MAETFHAPNAAAIAIIDALVDGLRLKDEQLHRKAGRALALIDLETQHAP